MIFVNSHCNILLILKSERITNLDTTIPMQSDTVFHEYRI